MFLVTLQLIGLKLTIEEILLRDVLCAFIPLWYRTPSLVRSADNIAMFRKYKNLNKAKLEHKLYLVSLPLLFYTIFFEILFVC